MGDVIFTDRGDLADIDLRWMLGRSVVRLTFHEPTLWVIGFSGAGYVQTEGIWRVLSNGVMRVISCDHGHQFGLPAPLDASALATAELLDSAIVDAQIDAAVPDLVIRFANGAILQVLVTSRGYECWTVRDPTGVCWVVRGDGSASTWKDQ